jgi:hypothetical protein
MSEKIVTALITGGIGLLGASLGLLGSVFATRKTVTLARVQRRFERVHEMRAEVLPTIYGNFLELFDRYRSVVTRVTQTNEAGKQQDVDGLKMLADARTQSARELVEINNHLEKIKTYFREHVLWLPKEARTPTVDLLESLGKELGEFQRLYRKALSEFEEAIRALPREEGEKTREVYAKHAEALYTPYAKFRNWLDNDGNYKLQTLARSYSKVLGIEDASF